MGIPLDWAGNRHRLGQDPSNLFLTRAYGMPGDIAVPDESLFGILSRRHVLSGHHSSGTSLTEILGRRTASPSTTFPSDIRAIRRHLLLPLSCVEELIERHTHLPYFRMFVSRPRYQDTMRVLASGAAAGTKISLGLVASRIGAADRLCYCPLCAQEDEAMIGVATWYRVHQLPGVLLCPYHGTPLLESDCLAKRLARLQLFLPNSVDTPFRNAADIESPETWLKLLLVSRLSAQTLVADVQIPETWSLRECYASHLLQRGLAASLARIRQHELLDQFLAFWAPIRRIHPFNCILNYRSMDGYWLASLCRKPRGIHHPLKHLLLIGFLTNDLASFIHPSFASSPAPLADGTMPELSSNRLERRLKTLMASQGMSAREAAAALHISTNTALIHAQRAKIPVTRRPKKLTPALHDRARSALARGDRVPQIATQLMLSASTINRLLGEDPGLQQQRAARLLAARRRCARDHILAALRKAATERNDLHAKCSADYVWLYRHDRTWLERHLHPAERHPATLRVDWLARDRDLCLQVRRVALGIIHWPGKPVRVTLNEIGRRTGHAAWLEKCLEKLPCTRKLLPTVVESTAAFRRRRYRWWKRILSGTSLNGYAPDWQIKRAAGIRHDDDDGDDGDDGHRLAA